MTLKTCDTSNSGLNKVYDDKTKLSATLQLSQHPHRASLETQGQRVRGYQEKVELGGKNWTTNLPRPVASAQT